MGLFQFYPASRALRFRLRHQEARSRRQSAFRFQLFPLGAPLHPNCYLSPTQFAEKFGLPKPEGARETPEKREKGEEEKGDAGGGDVGVLAEGAAETEAVAPASDQSEIGTPKPEIKRPHSLRTTLFFALGAILGVVATLIATGHLDPIAVWEQIRRQLTP